MSSGLTGVGDEDVCNPQSVLHSNRPADVELHRPWSRRRVRPQQPRCGTAQIWTFPCFLASRRINGRNDCGSKFVRQELRCIICIFDWAIGPGARRTRVRSVSFSALTSRVQRSSLSAGRHVLELAVDVVLGRYSMVQTNLPDGPAHPLRPPQPFGKQGSNPSTGCLSAARLELVLDHKSLPGALGAHVRRVWPAAARERGPPRQTSALPFLCFSELSDSLGPRVPIVVTSSSSCSSKLSIAGSRPHRPHLHFPNSHREARVSLCAPNARIKRSLESSGDSVGTSLTKSHRIFLCRFTHLRTACWQLLLGEIEAADATLWGVSFSGAAAHLSTPDHMKQLVRQRHLQMLGRVSLDNFG